MKTFACFLFLALVLALGDLGFFFVILARDFGVIGLIAWVTLHVCLGCALLRTADGALCPPRPFHLPADRTGAQGEPATRSGLASHRTAAGGIPLDS